MNLSKDETPHSTLLQSITAIDELCLTGKQDDDIAELINRLFNADLEGRSFAQNRHHRRYVAYEGNRLAGHLAICFRAIRLNDRSFNAIGIAEVAVDRPYRRHGLASALLQAALEDGKRSLADFALLFGTESLYKRAGFSNALNPLIVCNMPGGKTGPVTQESNASFMMKPLGEAVWDEKAVVDLAGFAF